MSCDDPPPEVLELLDKRKQEVEDMISSGVPRQGPKQEEYYKKPIPSPISSVGLKWFQD